MSSSNPLSFNDSGNWNKNSNNCDISDQWNKFTTELSTLKMFERNLEQVKDRDYLITKTPKK